MPEATDYYSVLGVPETADTASIKRAYRDLAHLHHPDRNGGAAADAFVAAQEAYMVLSDPDARRAYDRSRAASFVPLDAGRYHDAFLNGFEDVGRPHGGARFSTTTSADIETQVQLTFSQALRGGRTEVRLASGESVRLTLPQGIRSGVKVRVRGYGRPLTGGERGDLYVTFRVDRDERFRREGDNLHVVERVSALEAMIGTTRSITNAYGQTIKVPIAPGTQPGERLRLRGQGIVTKKRTGDLFVEIHVTVPRSLSEAQRAELEAFARQLGILGA